MGWGGEAGWEIKRMGSPIRLDYPGGAGDLEVAGLKISNSKTAQEGCMPAAPDAWRRQRVPLRPQQAEVRARGSQTGEAPAL